MSSKGRLYRNTEEHSPKSEWKLVGRRQKNATCSETRQAFGSNLPFFLLYSLQFLEDGSFTSDLQ